MGCKRYVSAATACGTCEMGVRLTLNWFLVQFHRSSIVMNMAGEGGLEVYRGVTGKAARGGANGRRAQKQLRLVVDERCAHSLSLQNLAELVGMVVGLEVVAWAEPPCASQVPRQLLDLC